MSATQFIQLVEQYPCIYNSDLPDYARKETTEKAWQEVAEEINWSITDCKEKWKNIRNGFVRSLKPSLNGIQKKPYYLYDAMQFVVPYINPNINIQLDKRRVQSPKSEQLSEDDLMQEIEIEVPDARPRRVRRPKRKILKKMPNDVDKAFVSWLQNKKPKVDDPRKMFLLSLLPDLKNLTEKQLGVFRIKVLLLLEEVKGQDSDSKDLLKLSEGLTKK